MTGHVLQSVSVICAQMREDRLTRCRVFLPTREINIASNVDSTSSVELRARVRDAFSASDEFDISSVNWRSHRMFADRESTVVFSADVDRRFL